MICVPARSHLSPKRTQQHVNFEPVNGELVETLPVWHCAAKLRVRDRGQGLLMKTCMFVCVGKKTCHISSWLHRLSSKLLCSSLDRKEALEL